MQSRRAQRGGGAPHRCDANLLLLVLVPEVQATSHVAEALITQHNTHTKHSPSNRGDTMQHVRTCVCQKKVCTCASRNCVRVCVNRECVHVRLWPCVSNMCERVGDKTMCTSVQKSVYVCVGQKRVRTCLFAGVSPTCACVSITRERVHVWLCACEKAVCVRAGAKTVRTCMQNESVCVCVCV